MKSNQRDFNKLKNLPVDGFLQILVCLYIYNRVEFSSFGFLIVNKIKLNNLIYINFWDNNFTAVADLGEGPRGVLGRKFFRAPTLLTCDQAGFF